MNTAPFINEILQDFSDVRPSNRGLYRCHRLAFSRSRGLGAGLRQI